MGETKARVPSGGRPLAAAASAAFATNAAVLRRYLRPEARRLGLLAACLLGATAVQLASPLILRRFIDGAASGRASLSTLWILAGVYLAASLGAQALQVGSTYASEQVAWGATNAMRRDVARHVLELDMAFHAARSPGELIERADGDVAALAGFFSQFILQVIGGALQLVGVLGVLLVADVRIGGALCVFAVIAAIALHASRKLATGRFEAVRQAWSDLSAFVEERVAGLDDIRANGGGAHVMARLAQLNRALVDSNVSAARRGQWIFLTASGLFTAGFGVTLALGVYLFERRQVTIGSVFMFVQYTGMMAAPLVVIGQQLQQFQAASASLGRLREILAHAPTIGDGDARTSGNPSRAPELRFDHIRFAYGAGPQVLDDVDLTLPAGAVLGLLGRTGSGKTTLSRLLFRLYDPASGAVRLDGTDIRELSLADLRERVGLVTQEVQLFHASVRDNATLFDERIPDAEVERALRTVGLGAWLDRQPQGLESLLPPGGGLSAGEAQLLAFARVFLRRPGLVILDEASSKLDPQTDADVERALDRLIGRPGDAGRRTTVIIAHKLSTVGRADFIAVLGGGRLLEFGPRARLEADPASAFSGLLRTGLAETPA